MIHRADRGEQVGFAALIVVDQRAWHVETFEVIANEFDQLQVGFTAGGIEPHQRLEQLDAVHRSSPATP
ncbi:hypothetical protein D3C78_1980650 [compost metagenome]